MSAPSSPIQIGVIGCGNISDAYFNGAARSNLIKVKACADLNPAAAQAKAAQHGVAAMSASELLADPDISIVINLTIPKAHAPVARQILDAGKHVYLEKPLSASFEEAQALMAYAKGKGLPQGLRIGCAPDTFFGAGHQATRRVIDSGQIGKAVGGAVAVLSHGAESWHPNPEFFYKPGGGPILDMGPYYVTQLVNLLGPVKRVAAIGTQGSATRTITSEPLNGQIIQVEVSTNVNGTLEFESGANITMSASWDVWANKRSFIEIYGTEGSVLGVNPNFFGSAPMVCKPNGDWQAVDIAAHPFGVDNRPLRNGSMAADYRIVGVLDMAMAIRQNRPHRASGDLALHVLEVLEAFERSSVEGRHIAIQTRCARPEAVPLGVGEEVFA